MLMFYGLRKQNHIRGVFKTQSNIYEWSFIAKIVNGFKPLAFFVKDPLQLFDWVLNTPLHICLWRHVYDPIKRL